MTRTLYELLFILGYLAYVPKAMWRKRLPHDGWMMRLGCYPQSVHDRLKGKRPVWIHAVSVGEAQAAKPLIEAARELLPREPIVVSSITPGGFGLAAKYVGETGAAIYWPMDLRRCVRRALDTIRPRVLILMESELWPQMLQEASARGIPVVVANGRVSLRAFARYRRIKSWVRGMLDHVSLWIMQSQTDADRILSLGVNPSRIVVPGSLKWDASIGLRPKEEDIRALRNQLGLAAEGGCVIVGGSTHRGEEKALLAAFVQLRRTHPQAKLILAPRHLERVAEVLRLAKSTGLRAATLAEIEHADDKSWNILVVDVFGRLSQFYALAAVVFIGGSLIRHGGQNPLEAAGLGKPTVFGPWMFNFTDIARTLLSYQAACQIKEAAELFHVLIDFLDDPKSAAAIGERAKQVTERSRGSTARSLEALKPFLQDTASGSPHVPIGT